MKIKLIILIFLIFVAIFLLININSSTFTFVFRINIWKIIIRTYKDLQVIFVCLERCDAYTSIEPEKIEGATVSEAAVKSLENKVFKKFGLVEEKIKKLIDENFNTKKELKSLNNILDGQVRNTDEKFKNLENAIQELQKKHEEDLANLEYKINNNTQDLINTEIEKIRQELNKKQIKKMIIS